MGYLGDRHLGRKRVLLLSFVGAGLSYSLVGTADTLWLLALSRVVVGLTKQTTTCATALLTEISDESTRGATLGRLSSALTLAFALGQSVGGRLVGLYGRRAPCALASTLYALDIVLVQYMLTDPRARAPATPAAPTAPAAPTNGPRTRAAVARAAAAPPPAGLCSRLRRLAYNCFVAFGSAGGHLLALRLAYSLLMRSVYSMHALYEAQRCDLGGFFHTISASRRIFACDLGEYILRDASSGGRSRPSARATSPRGACSSASASSRRSSGRSPTYSPRGRCDLGESSLRSRRILPTISANPPYDLGESSPRSRRILPAISANPPYDLGALRRCSSAPSAPRQ